MDYGTLYIEENGIVRQRVPLMRGVIRIGRAPPTSAATAQVVIGDAAVSAEHILITAVETGAYVTDVSTNGTWINEHEKPLDKQVSRLLYNGDRITIETSDQTGQLTIRYVRAVIPAIAAPPPEIAAAIAPVARRQRARAALLDDLLRSAERAEPALEHPRSQYMEHLPAIFHRNNLVNNLLLGSEHVWLPIEQMLDAIHWYSQPQIAPQASLERLESWFELELDPALSVERRRIAIAAAASCFRKRGTRQGMIDWLHAVTGYQPAIEEHGDASGAGGLQPHEFRVTIIAPQAERHELELLIQPLIEMFKPADTTAKLDWKDP